jgi:hypothetical protein
MGMHEFQLPSFQEDGFDLEQHKKTANTYAQIVTQSRRVRRKVGFLKIIIFIVLFAAGYFLYYFSSELIARHDYNRHHNTEFVN